MWCGGRPYSRLDSEGPTLAPPPALIMYFAAEGAGEGKQCFENYEQAVCDSSSVSSTPRAHHRSRSFTRRPITPECTLYFLSSRSLSHDAREKGYALRSALGE